MKQNTWDESNPDIYKRVKVSVHGNLELELSIVRYPGPNQPLRHPVYLPEGHSVGTPMIFILQATEGYNRALYRRPE